MKFKPFLQNLVIFHWFSTFILMQNVELNVPYTEYIFDYKSVNTIFTTVHIYIDDSINILSNEWIRFLLFHLFFFCKQVGKFEFRTLKCEFDKRATRSLSSLQIIEREKDKVLNVASQNWCAIEVGRGNEENDIALDTNRNSYQLITMKWTLHIWVIV